MTRYLLEWRLENRPLWPCINEMEFGNRTEKLSQVRLATYFPLSIFSLKGLVVGFRTAFCRVHGIVMVM